MRKSLLCFLLVLFCCINIQAKPSRSSLEKEILLEALSKDSTFQALSAQKDFLKKDLQDYLLKLNVMEYPEHANLREAEECVKNPNFWDKNGASDYPVPIDWFNTIGIWILWGIVGVICLILAIVFFECGVSDAIFAGLWGILLAVCLFWCLAIDIQGTYLAKEVNEYKTKKIPELKATIQYKKQHDAILLLKKNSLSRVKKKISIIEKHHFDLIQSEVNSRFAKETKIFENDMRKLSFRKNSGS